MAARRPRQPPCACRPGHPRPRAPRVHLRRGRPTRGHPVGHAGAPPRAHAGHVGTRPRRGACRARDERGGAAALCPSPRGGHLRGPRLRAPPPLARRPARGVQPDGQRRPPHLLSGCGRRPALPRGAPRQAWRAPGQARIQLRPGPRCFRGGPPAARQSLRVPVLRAPSRRHCQPQAPRGAPPQRGHGRGRARAPARRHALRARGTGTPVAPVGNAAAAHPGGHQRV
mmetsp:Transcript_20268/g.59769  ORF Transcript_20268/g.59769 Transcript_20268/m.59769 type:complete len:227 (-) Transcript_20268:522-1202(-)